MSEVINENARPDNPDRAFLQMLIERKARGVRLEMNPALASLNAVLLEAVPGVLCVRFSAPPESIQGNGVVAGGTLTSMLDFAMALALLSKLPVGRTCATISLTVNMLEAGRIGDFVARARIERLGGRIAFLSGDLFDRDGERRIAQATASFVVSEVRG